MVYGRRYHAPYGLSAADSIRKFILGEFKKLTYLIRFNEVMEAWANLIIKSCMMFLDY